VPPVTPGVVERRRGERYEKWVRTHVARICAEIGVDMGNARIWSEKPFSGTLNYRSDLWVDTGDDVVVVECKANQPTSGEILHMNYKVRDIARRMPDRTVHGIMITAKAPTRASQAALAPDLEGLALTREIGSLSLLVAPPRLLEGSVLMWLMQDGEVEARVLRRGKRARAIETLEEALQDSSAVRRLAAALELLSRNEASGGLRLQAAMRSAHDFLHLGEGVEARYMSMEAATRANELGSKFDFEAASVVTASAEYRMALDARRATQEPAREAVRRLTGSLFSFDTWSRTAALQLLGPWHALYGDVELGRSLLKQSLVEAEKSETLYHLFIGHVRLADTAGNEGRVESIREAAALLPHLSAEEREWGDSLIDGLAEGRDVSIAKPLR
jgi:hypothetical protein